MRCPNPACGTEIPLLRALWLANSARNVSWVEIQGKPGRVDLSVRLGPPPHGEDPSTGAVKASSVVCPSCAATTIAKDVRHYGKQVGFGSRLYAVLDVRNGTRVYRSPRPDEIEAAEQAVTFDELAETPDGTSPLPDEQITKSQFRILRSLVYGIDTYRGLFNNRQLSSLALSRGDAGGVCGDAAREE